MILKPVPIPGSVKPIAIELMEKEILNRGEAVTGSFAVTDSGREVVAFTTSDHRVSVLDATEIVQEMQWIVRKAESRASTVPRPAITLSNRGVRLCKKVIESLKGGGIATLSERP